MIQTFGVLEVSGAYLDPKKALHDIPHILPDVVFADVEMPTINGIELAQKIRHLDEGIQIVFVTAYEKYAVEAFRVNAVDYVLKPILRENLEHTVNRLIQNYNNRLPSASSRRKHCVLTFGTFSVYGAFENQNVRWQTTKVRELFACFVMSEGETLEKWVLCNRLWPQSPPKQAEHCLHSTISRLKSSLQKAGIPNEIVREAGGYRMNTSGLSCDAWELQQFLKCNSLVNHDNLLHYERVLGLYHGDLFEAEDYFWSIPKRESLRSLYLSSAKKVGAYLILQNRYCDAEIWLQQVFHADPLDEELAAMLLQLYSKEGRMQKLMDCYETLQTTLKFELGIDPSPNTQRLYLNLLRNFPILPKKMSDLPPLLT